LADADGTHGFVSSHRRQGATELTISIIRRAEEGRTIRSLPDAA